MSEENLQKPAETAISEDTPSISLSEDIEVTINKATNELTIKDPATGRLITFKANIVEPEEDEEDSDEGENDEPLSPDDFQEALQRINSLGLTWTIDRVLEVSPKNPESEDALYSEEFKEIQLTYPTLPRELTAVVYHTLTGRDAPESIVGNKDDLKKKVAVVRNLVITPELRSEFFFKNAIKVPYFESVDWEIVLKTHERGVADMPGSAYALLLLTFHNTNSRVSRIDEHENKTVAADINLVNKLIRTFVDIKTALEDAQRLTKLFNELPSSEDKDDATTTQHQLQ